MFNLGLFSERYSVARDIYNQLFFFTYGHICHKMAILWYNTFVYCHHSSLHTMITNFVPRPYIYIFSNIVKCQSRLLVLWCIFHNNIYGFMVLCFYWNLYPGSCNTFTQIRQSYFIGTGGNHILAKKWVKRLIPNHTNTTKRKLCT